MKLHAAWARQARGYLDCVNERLYYQAYEPVSLANFSVAPADAKASRVEYELSDSTRTAVAPNVQPACGGTSQLKTAVMQFRNQILRFHDDVLQYPLSVYNKVCCQPRLADASHLFDNFNYTTENACADVLSPVLATSGAGSGSAGLTRPGEHVSASSIERELIHRNVEQFQTQVEQIYTQQHLNEQALYSAKQSCQSGEAALSTARNGREDIPDSMKADIREKIHAVKHARFSALRLSSGLLNSKMEYSADLKSTIADAGAETLKYRLLSLLGVAEGPFSDDSIVRSVERLAQENTALRRDNAQMMARMAEILAKYPADDRVGR